jgi:hypothetical protein
MKGAKGAYGRHAKYARHSASQSDGNVVASLESISETSWHSKVDLLSRTKEEATRMLYKHLTKSCFGGEGDDNLMSWSSSLLFVIQYATTMPILMLGHPAISTL